MGADAGKGSGFGGGWGKTCLPMLELTRSKRALSVPETQLLRGCQVYGFKWWLS